MAPEDLVGRRSAVSRRIAALAFALVLAAMLARVLTLPLPAPHWFAELGVGVFALVYSAIVIRFLDRGWMRGDVVVILRGVVASLIAGSVVALAAGYFDGIAILAALAFTAILVNTPPAARARAVAARSTLVLGGFSLLWLLWHLGDVPTLLVVIALLAATQLVAIAQIKGVGAAAESDRLRSSAHGVAAERVGTAIDVLGVTRAVLETGRASFPLTTHAAVLLYDVSADRLRPLPLYLGPAGVRSLDGDGLDFTMSPGEGLSGRVFASSRPMLWPTAYDVSTAQTNLGEQVREQMLGLHRGVALCAVGAPLIVDDEVIGVYMLTSHRRELVWSEEDIPVVSALAGEAARAIERARRYERELDQAHLDSITGLANHRQLTRTLDQEVARAKRRTTTLGVVFCDLDRFKTVNDTFGHAAGDRVLTILAEVFHASLRREDSAARYGGDEFVCVLPGADHAEASAVGLRISNSFEIRVREDPELSGAGVTISCGVAIFPDDADDVDRLLQHADAAMREVKESRHAGTTEQGRGR